MFDIVELLHILWPVSIGVVILIGLQFLPSYIKSLKPIDYILTYYRRIMGIIATLLLLKAMIYYVLYNLSIYYNNHIPGFSRAYVPAINIYQKTGIESKYWAKLDSALIKYFVSNIAIRHESIARKILIKDITYNFGMKYLDSAIIEILISQLTRRVHDRALVLGYWIGIPELRPLNKDVHPFNFCITSQKYVLDYTVAAIILCRWLEQMHKQGIKIESETLIQKAFNSTQRINYPILTKQLFQNEILDFIQEYSPNYRCEKSS